MAEETYQRPYGRRNKKITPEKAKEILANKDQKLEDIHNKLALLYKEIERLEQPDELMEAAALPSKTVKMVCRWGNGHSDTYGILKRFYRQRKERGTEIRMQLWKLSEEEEDIRRLWGCFFVLQEPYYGILYDLYVKKELYAAAETEFGYSHRMFEKRRKEGLELLADMFNSPYSILQLMELAPAWRRGEAKKEKAGAVCAG